MARSFPFCYFMDESSTHLSLDEQSLLIILIRHFIPRLIGPDQVAIQLRLLDSFTTSGRCGNSPIGGQVEHLRRQLLTPQSGYRDHQQKTQPQSRHLMAIGKHRGREKVKSPRVNQDSADIIY